jgi:phosphoenolpyruvate phosphomutase
MTALRELLHTPGKLVKLAGAHDALGARLAEEAGFDGVWASSFEIATAHGVPDGSVLPASCRLTAAAALAAAVRVPVVADCETGPERVEQVAEMVRRYEDAGVQAVCMEDAGTPRCSLLPGPHSLAPLEEFAAKIAAARRARGELLILARVQALVAGRGQAEALRRARAYAACGADVVVIHSRSPSPDEVLAFAAAWDGEAPLTLIPTTYHALTEEQIRRMGKVRMVIYANYGLRAAIAAVKRALRQILAEGGAHEAETWVASLDEVFALQQVASAACPEGEG